MIEETYLKIIISGQKKYINQGFDQINTFIS